VAGAGASPTLPTAEEVAAAVAVAAGRRAGDLLLRGGRVVDVFTNAVIEADVLVSGRLVAAVGQGLGQAREVVDLAGAYVSPGLIDGHMHLESSLVTPSGYAEVAVPRGVTAVVCDPHEIANVAGEAGVRWLLDTTGRLPLDVWVTVPSCVPSTPLETSGAEFGIAEMGRLAEHPRVVGVAEIMSFPEVIAGEATALAKAALAASRGVTAEGHAPGVTGRDLQAYLAAGIASDHESTTLEEGREKLRAGAFLMVREGSVTRDLRALLPLVDPRHGDRVGFVTDDRLPHDLLVEGGVDHMVRSAIAGGVDPAYAVRCASWNNARHYRLPRRGAVAPGYFADLVVVGSLAAFDARRVYKDGVLVANGGAPTARPAAAPADALDDGPVRGTMRLPRLGDGSFALPVPPGGGRVRCVVALPNRIVTGSELVEPTVVDGAAVADPGRDLAKLACVERHGRNGGVAVALVRGFGLERGALASSVGHDHHNVMVVGVDDEDMAVACRRLAELGGGFVAVAAGAVRTELPLPLAGIVTDAPLKEVAADLDRLDAAAASLGVTMPSPFMALSFLGLAVIPELKLTDRGLVDVARGRLVPLWEA
jgi:adenine deaminase